LALTHPLAVGAAAVAHLQKMVQMAVLAVEVQQIQAQVEQAIRQTHLQRKVQMAGHTQHLEIKPLEGVVQLLLEQMAEEVLVMVVMEPQIAFRVHL
jgi:membrane protein insertase Oxa1/YidC/SpoIIIJ